MKCPKCQSNNPDTQQFCGECGTRVISSEEIPVSYTKTLETPRDEFTRGTTFAERYEFMEELGTGGMGKVYKVFDKKIKEEVALKILKPEIASDEKTIERFSNELKLARKIRHENVCQMFDINEEEGTHYITMEYVPGEDLKSFIRRVGQLPVGKSLSISKQVCEGLSEAHKLGTVHRDLKPSNIMIDKEGNARIMDFGIARSLKAKGITGAGVMIGTPEYMSPEQVEGKEVDQRSDIYSLGVILYEMVTGRVPFQGDTPFTIGIKHKSEEPQDPNELNAQIPEELSRVILRCMEKDKENRCQSAGELRSELTRIEQGIPTTGREIPKRKPTTSKEITVTFSPKKLFIPSLVAVLAIIAVLIWQLLPQKQAVFAPKIENSIAVISFENQTGDEAYDYLQKVIPNLLITNLENTGDLHVTTWERMRDLLKQMGKKDIELIDSDLGFEVSRREGIEAIVVGSFTKWGETFAIDVKILDVETMDLVTSKSSQGEGINSILKTQIDELSREISQGIGISREKIEASKLGITDITTTSMEAYNYFLRGLDASEKYNSEEARQLLEKAVELDPTFATAHLYLAQTYGLLRNTKARNEAFENAMNYAKRASEKERLYIEADYANYIERDPEKRFSILSQMVKKYPREKRIHYTLGRYYSVGRNHHKAKEEYNRALELDPNFEPALNELGYAYAYLEDYEKAIECFKKYTSLFPREPNPLDSWAETYFRMGRLDDAIAKYKEALIVKPDYYNTYWKIGYIYALKENYPQAINWINQDISIAPTLSAKADGGYIWKGIYYAWLGRLDQALPELKRAIEIWKDVENKDWESVTERIIGWIYYDRGELESCRRYFKSGFDTIIKNYPESISLYTVHKSFNLGLVELKEGRIDSAKTRLSEMKSLLPKINPTNIYAPFYYDLLNGEVLLAEGSVDEAIAVCENARTLGTPAISYSFKTIMYSIPFLNDVLARAYRQKGELDKAIAEYERLITFDPSSKERRLIHPKLHYRLAKLYEEKGWIGKAIEGYEKFLDLWKDADPGIAEVEDAKKRLARLKQTD